MRPAFFLITLFLFFFTTSFSMAVEGGEVAEVNLTSYGVSSSWGGLYGRVLLGGLVNYSVNLSPNQVLQLHLLALRPPCDYSILTAHVVAVNGTLNPPLRPGNLSLLSSIVPYPDQTFTFNSSFYLLSHTIDKVPSTYLYANNTTVPYFREGYLNDAVGNLVFASTVSFNRLDWNNSISDYELLLPAGVNFTVFVDLSYICRPPEEGGKRHRLVLKAPPRATFAVDEEGHLRVVLENKGDYVERDVRVDLICPEPLFCSSTLVPRLGRGEAVALDLVVFSPSAGEFPSTIKAENRHSKAASDILLIFEEVGEKEQGEKEPVPSLPPTSTVSPSPFGPFLVVEVGGPYIEGEPVDVYVYDDKGNPIPGALVRGGSLAYTDASGYARVILSYEGVIFVSKEGFPSVSLTLPVIRKAKVVAAGTVYTNSPFLVKVLDSKGLPVKGARIIVDGQIFRTDDEGKALVVVSSEGSHKLVAFASGYLITPAKVLVRSPPSPYLNHIPPDLCPLFLILLFLLLLTLLGRPLKKVFEEWMGGRDNNPPAP